MPKVLAVDIKVGAFDYAISENDVRSSSNHGIWNWKPSFAMFPVIFCKHVIFKKEWSATTYNYWRSAGTGDT